jgi:hypothetical protein
MLAVYESVRKLKAFRLFRACPGLSRGEDLCAPRQFKAALCARPSTSDAAHWEEIAG